MIRLGSDKNYFIEQNYQIILIILLNHFCLSKIQSNHFCRMPNDASGNSLQKWPQGHFQKNISYRWDKTRAIKFSGLVSLDFFRCFHVCRASKIVLSCHPGLGVWRTWRTWRKRNSGKRCKTSICDSKPSMILSHLFHSLALASSISRPMCLVGVISSALWWITSSTFPL